MFTIAEKVVITIQAADYGLYLIAWVIFWFLVWRILTYIFNKFER